jgi:hypothetical protein
MRFEFCFVCFLAVSCLASGQDTSSGLEWGPIIQLSKDSCPVATAPRIAAQGETLHVTWEAGGYRLPISLRREKRFM